MGDLTEAVICADLQGEVKVGRNLGRLVARRITSSFTVAGSLNTLTTSSKNLDHTLWGPMPAAEVMHHSQLVPP
jgi:hypothetical protein